MSDIFLIFIPTDPKWSPTSDAAEAALDYLRSIAPNKQDIEAVFSDRVEIYTGMENWSGVSCPRCGSDIEDWFFPEAGRAFEKSQFDDLQATMPCCQQTSSLNDLAFGWPAGFARFAIRADRPGVDPTAEQVSSLATLLGHPVRKIWELC